MRTWTLLMLGALVAGCGHEDASSPPATPAPAPLDANGSTGATNAMPDTTLSAPPHDTAPERELPTEREAVPPQRTMTPPRTTTATTLVPPQPATPVAPSAADRQAAPPPAAPPSGPDPRSDADNTGINKRDRGNAHPTPTAQSNAPEDLKMVAAIRRALMADHSLSSMAKNIKVITSDGIVFLRGPVRDARERDAIETKARAVDGVKDVDNQIDIK